jgi:uncharacterized secreted protein with C-terminal beta-propeller domain
MFNFTCHRAVFLVSSLSLICLSESALAATKVKKIQPQKIASTFALAKLLKKHNTNRFGPMMIAYSDKVLSTTANGAVAKSTSVNHTQTNIQVAGVDESDRAKVDDNGYIYQLVNNQVIITKAFPIEQLSQSAIIVLPEGNFSPTGLYLQAGKLVVVGNTWQELSPPVEFKNITSPTAKMAYGGWWGYMRNTQTRTIIYDVSDQTKPKQIRDVVVDGDYLDSRRIGNYLYFITRSYPRYYMMPSLVSTNPLFMKTKDILPSISDSKAGKTSTKTMALKDVVYFPDFVEPDYVVVASIDLDQPQKEVVTKAYLGAGDLVYASHENLYLSASKYNFGGNGDDVIPKNITTTQIFKIGIDAGKMNFVAAGEVKGTALNQFSMDEQGDYFRIATTTNSWSSETNESYSSLFVLNKEMKTVGKIDKLGEREDIYATRFMGNRCYIVTFKLTDPLFAIDLSNPLNPTVMGELKIPGYSNYLHPYDETHLIGFGKEAAVYQPEKSDVASAGTTTDTPWWTGGSAFYQGLKVVLFDVADMTNPKQVGESVSIGDRGTDSPILWDHKALYWDAEKHLFGFPVQESLLTEPFDPNKPWNYGKPTFQGAYIYEVTPEKGFTLKARLSQIPVDMKPKTESYNDYSYSYWESEATNYFVDRILRVDESLYTLSNNQINVYGLDNYKKLNTLVIKPQVNSQK